MPISQSKKFFSQLLSVAGQKNYPTISLVDGRDVFVDTNGLLHPGRKSLLPPPCPDEIQLAEKWLKLVTGIRSRSTSGGSNSYRVKHVIEYCHRVYICNGAAIVALHRTGWMQRTDHRSLSTTCNLSARWLDKIDEGQQKKRRALSEDD